MGQTFDMLLDRDGCYNGSTSAWWYTGVSDMVLASLLAKLHFFHKFHFCCCCSSHFPFSWRWLYGVLLSTTRPWTILWATRHRRKTHFAWNCFQNSVKCLHFLCHEHFLCHTPHGTLLGCDTPLWQPQVWFSLAFFGPHLITASMPTGFILSEAPAFCIYNTAAIIISLRISACLINVKMHHTLYAQQYMNKVVK